VAWWKGCDMAREVGKDGKPVGEKVHIDTLHDGLDKFFTIPPRPVDKPFRMPVSSVHNIKGVGHVICGRAEQGVCKPGDELIYVPSNTPSNPCTGRVFTIEMHHKSQPICNPGDNVGMNIKGLNKDYLPKPGDIAILASDTSLKPCTSFVVQSQVISCANSFSIGYCPIGFVRTARTPCKLVEIMWRIGKDTNGQKVENPIEIKTGDMVQCRFVNMSPFVVDTFKNCENLSRIAFLDGSAPVMIGKIMEVDHDPYVPKLDAKAQEKADAKAEAKAKDGKAKEPKDPKAPKAPKEAKAPKAKGEAKA